MKIIFTQHAKMRLHQRTKLNMNEGYSFIRKGMQEPSNLHIEYVNKYREKQTGNVTIIAYKHLMFVVRIENNKIFVITVLIIH